MFKVLPSEFQTLLPALRSLLKHVIEAFLRHLDQYTLCSIYDLLSAREVMNFKLIFHVGKKKVTRSHVRALGHACGTS